MENWRDPDEERLPDTFGRPQNRAINVVQHERRLFRGNGRREMCAAENEEFRRFNAGNRNFHRNMHRQPQSTTTRANWRPRNFNINQQMQEGNRNNLPQLNHPSRLHSTRENASRTYRMGFKRLEELSDKEPDEIIPVLINKNNGFEDILNTELRSDYIVLIVRVLAKMCQSSFDATKATIMHLISKEKFINQLTNFILHLPLQSEQDRQRNKYFWNSISSFGRNVYIISESMINTIPTTACDKLPQLFKAITMAMPSFETEIEALLTEEVKEKLLRLEKKLKLIKIEIEKKKEDCHQNPNEIEPPDDFREKDIYPTTQEITTFQSPILRENIIFGAYRNVDHYLDVQFRLLREDFVAPLREGICHFIQRQMQNDMQKKRITSVRVYPHVEFLNPHYVRDQVGILLQFNFTKTPKKFNFENSKRMMFGSLLCFTKDNFATFIFGKIIDRDSKLLQKNQIVVGFESGFDDYETKIPYIMVECNVYFEPYYHVLKALQTMNEENFPMKKYIVDVDHEIQAPKYLNDLAMYKIDNQNFPVLHNNAWPTADTLGLDDTQHRAFRSALTQEFAVIQGPPGTGKTYVGLKIVKTLINNNQYWFAHNSTPILIVCYTNHALDQFLEGLLDTTQKIVRVGGQSKNQILSQYNIKELRRSIENRKVRHLLYEKRGELASKLNSIKLATNNLEEALKYKGILKFSKILGVDPVLHNSWFEKAEEQELIKWFLGGHSVEERRAEREEAHLAERQRVLQQQVDSEDDDSNEEFFDADNREENRLDVEDDICDLLEAQAVGQPYLLNLSSLKKQISTTKDKLAEEMNGQQPDLQIFNKRLQLEGELTELEENYEYLQFRLNQGKTIPVRELPRNIDINIPFNMTPVNRWRFYFYWLGQYCNYLKEKLTQLDYEYRHLYKEYNEIRYMEDIKLFKMMHIIGMTTTGAARLQTLLQALKCPIVVVEEAAEVLESHIIVSLTNHCRHLILIGDHQQLRPSTADYRMEKQYKLGISLFERMVNNKMYCSTLGVQHRMRPEIAKLIVPAIYERLENHESVLQCPPILGVENSVYFLHHNKPESLSGDSSKKNEHEATFLIHLTRHLILNGYKPDEITILAAYSGQMFLLRNEKKKYHTLLQNVRISVLDNYQGEECRIILLSLVRNNNENSIGFLAIENRVCVALSRAKEGFYIMGNMDLLCNNSKVWPKIRDVLTMQGFLGESLQLRCQIHTDQITDVKKAEDFSMASEGGCSKPCNTLLHCGHICKMLCHLQNRDHTEFKCTQNCIRLLCDNNHPCKKMCFEDCGPCMVLMKRHLSCGHEQHVPCHMDPETFNCQTLVSTTLPCGHVCDKPCYANPEKFWCPVLCDARVEPCGHACRYTCHFRKDPDHLEYKCFENCAKPQSDCSTGHHRCPKRCYEECPPCMVVIKKKRTVCPHTFDTACNNDVNNIICKKPCTKKLLCEHPCKLKCFEPCGNCKVKMDKKLPICGHIIKAICSEEPNRQLCKGKCPLTLNCGHPCTKKCNEPCNSRCMTFIDHQQNVACGHIFKIPCYLNNTELKGNEYKLLRYCKEPCKYKLECGHICKGTCGECAQGRLHSSCKEECGVILVCGHECLTPCRETCQPCSRPCTFRCKHSACKKKCGEPCTPCAQKCSRNCKHITCNKNCGELCTIESCTKPCEKLLKCDHPCVGFCNEKCPPLCKICNKDELIDYFFGTEDEDNARFVLLEECGHIVESEGMEMWLQQGDNVVNAKLCPKCKTPLGVTQRYSNYIKKAYKDVIAVKEKFYGNSAENKSKRKQLQEKLDEIIAACSTLKTYSNKVPLILNKFETSLMPVKLNRRQPLHNLLANTYTAQIQIFEQIVNIFETTKLRKPQTIKILVDCINFLITFLLNQQDRITNQEIVDYESEIKRLARIAQLCQIEEDEKFAPAFSMSDNVKKLHNSLIDALLEPVRYIKKDMDIELKLKELNIAIRANVAITAQERQQIVRAIGARQGQWFKCPNGHCYVITECGGAMQTSVCNECKAPIGGNNHALLATNRLAPEMDGATYAAWSEIANNMGNFQF